VLGAEVYSSAGDAFTHVAVREYFDLDDEDALKYCDVSGSHDKGVDAAWFDDENRRMVVVQAKWANTEKSFQKDAVADVERAYRWLIRIGAGTSVAAAPRVIDAAHQLRDLREAEPDYRVQLFAIAPGSFTRGAREEATRVNDELVRTTAEVTLVSLDDLLAEIERRLDRDLGFRPNARP
jgi:hypothetical protein